VVLAGVKSVTLLDDATVGVRDLSAQFYLAEADAGKKRAAACKDRLQELNTAVAVSVAAGWPTDEELLKFQARTPALAADRMWASSDHALQLRRPPAPDGAHFAHTEGPGATVHCWARARSRVWCMCGRVDSVRCLQVVVLTGTPLAEALRVDELCHRAGVAFIRADVRGVFARVFCDFGPAFTVFDVDGAALETVARTCIECRQPFSAAPTAPASTNSAHGTRKVLGPSCVHDVLNIVSHFVRRRGAGVRDRGRHHGRLPDHRNVRGG